MKTLFLVLLLHAGVEYVAILPERIEVPTVQIKKSKGKGKGKKPYFLKFM